MLLLLLLLLLLWLQAWLLGPLVVESSSFSCWPSVAALIAVFAVVVVSAALVHHHTHTHL